MAVETLAEHIRDELGERVLGTDIAYDQLTVKVDSDFFPQVARFCKNDLGMTFFDFLSAVDEREEGFSVVARLYNHVKRTSVILKTMVPGGRDEPKVPTLTGVYAGANWHERECYDMFGIIFEGHPGLLPRILTVENFEGWPLRKEFKLASRVVKPWPGAKEPADSSEGDKKDAKPESANVAEPEDRAAAAKAKAERAKKKAAAARKRKAEERAAAEAAETTPGSEEPASQPQPESTAAEAAEAVPEAEADTVDEAEPGSAREAASAAAGMETDAHTPDPTTPEGASKIADDAVAKDAAAGTTVGEEVATGEQTASGEPKLDPDAESDAATAGAPSGDEDADTTTADDATEETTDE